MRVAEDHRGKSCGSRIQVKIFDVVKYVDACARDFQNVRRWQFASPCAGIDISAHDRYRRKLLELPEYLLATNITRMNDSLRTAKCFDCFRTKQPVRVGNDANDDAG